MIWNITSISNGLDEVAKCRVPLLAELKSLLDSYNNWNKSPFYYDVIAGDWLEHFMHLTYDAMVEIAASGGAKNQKYRIPVTADVGAYDTLRWQRSGLHEHLRSAVEHLLSGGLPTPWQFSADSVQILSGGEEGIAHKAIRAVATTQPDVLMVAPYFRCGRAEVFKALMGWRKWAALDNLDYPINFSVALNSNWRLKKSFEAYPANDLLGILRILLPLHLPVSLLEGFSKYRNAVHAYAVVRPKAVYSANALHANLPFKILAAEWRECGTKLLYHQHGGGYGVDKVHAFEEYETRVSDYYFTWGWSSANYPKVGPLSPSMLHVPKGKKRHILLICDDYPVVFYRLHFQPMPGGIEIMHSETCEFLTAWRDCKTLLIRAHVHDYSGKFMSMMRKVAPDATFDDRSVSSFQRFSQSNLVVHNYLGTTYLETLALNIPTVCFYDPNVYAFREEAKPFMDELASVGILHQSGRSASHFVASIANDIDGWWSQAEVQHARSRFVKNYANFDPEWKSQWERKFRDILDE